MNLMPITLFLLILNSPWVQALPGGFSNCLNGPSFQKNVGLVQKAAMIGGEDRQSVEEYARSTGSTVEAVAGMFAATGVIMCGPVSATVQLTGKKNMVTTVSHAFYRVRDCRFFEPTNCTVKFPLSGSDRLYKIKSNTFESGGCTAPFKIKNKQDWAVFELTTEVEGVTPYDVPEAPNEVAEGTAILQVASYTDNFRPRQPSRFFQNIQNCQVRNRRSYANISLQTDCDTGVGASGAGQLVNINGRLTLAAISVGGTSNLPDPRNPQDRRPPVAEYDKALHFSISVALDGDFLRILHERLGTRVSRGR